MQSQSNIPKECGVYKITNPNGRVYVGSSKNLYNRYMYYKNTYAPKQSILNRSFLKYGFSNHIFEIICLCDELDRYNKEREFGLKFNSLNEHGGLNIILPKSTDKPCVYSKLLIDKFREIGLNRKYSKETIQKFSASKIEHYKNNEHHHNKPVIDLQNGVFYKSVTEAAHYNNMKRTTLLEHLNGNRIKPIKLKYA
jgi:group I intron endonuclease